MCSTTNSSPTCFLGIDVGTSGIRAVVIDSNQNVLASCMQNMPAPDSPQPHYYQQEPAIWWQTLSSVLTELGQQFSLKQIAAFSIDATSGTVLLANQLGEPRSVGLMYNDQRAVDFAEKIKQFANADSPACSASSGLAKALWLLSNYPGSESETMYIVHQADWLASKLTLHFNHSDSNNALKTGFDPLTDKWPDWIAQLGIDIKQLPEVSKAGTPLCKIDSGMAEQFGINPSTFYIVGTTDSTAALLATGANKIGDAVTSLGSSLVLKIISDTPVFDTILGVYSQPFGKYWLVGGASNSGGAVLRHYFTVQQMSELESQLDFATPTQLQYYPLLQNGERFPVNNPQQAAKISPRPDSDVVFFQALLEGISAIEKQGYETLHACGAPAAERLFSIGGGATNKVWTAFRQQQLNIPVCEIVNNQAAFGTAVLAQQGYDKLQ